MHEIGLDRENSLESTQHTVLLLRSDELKIRKRKCSDRKKRKEKLDEHYMWHKRAEGRRGAERRTLNTPSACATIAIIPREIYPAAAAAASHLKCQNIQQLYDKHFQ